jgi:hypothetical protein
MAYALLGRLDKFTAKARQSQAVFARAPSLAW